MSKNKKTKKQEKIESSSYKLNTSAVDRLVNADKKTYPDTKVDPGKQYRSKDFLGKIPTPIKTLFIKFWFNGAVCFFIYWGLASYVAAYWDMILILAVVLGVVNDLLVNNSLRFFATVNGGNDKWMMFPQKKYWTLFANIFYSAIVLAGVMGIYFVLYKLAGIQVEPILFGVSYVAIDMLFIGIKNLLIKIINDAKEKTKND